MADIVNLRMARKGKRRTEAAAEAEANRLQHGRTKAERLATTGALAFAERYLDGHKRGDDPSGPAD